MEKADYVISSLAELDPRSAQNARRESGDMAIPNLFWRSAEVVSA